MKIIHNTDGNVVIHDGWYVKETACFPACWKVTKDGRLTTDIGDNSPCHFFRVLEDAEREMERRNFILWGNLAEYERDCSALLPGDDEASAGEAPSDKVIALVNELERVVQHASVVLEKLQEAGEGMDLTKDSLSEIENDIRAFRTKVS